MEKITAKEVFKSITNPANFVDWIFVLALFSTPICTILGLILVLTVSIWWSILFGVPLVLFFVIWLPLAEINWRRRTKSRVY